MQNRRRNFLDSLRNINSQEGSTLLSAIIGIGVLGILTAMTAKQLTQGFRSSARMTSDAERVEFRRQIAEAVDCRLTLTPYGANSANSISNAIPEVALRRGNDSIFLPEGGRRFGNWYARAVVEAWPGGPQPFRLQIRIAQPRDMTNPDAPNTPGNYRPDPLQGPGGTTELNWIHPGSPVFGDIGLCQSFFDSGSAWQACPAGQRQVGIDYERSPICVDNAVAVTCPAGQLVNEMLSDGTVVCGDKNTAQACPSGQKFTSLNADGSMVCTDMTTDQSCPPGQKQIGTTPLGVVKCGVTNEFAASCGTGQKVLGVSPTGAPICSSTVSGSTCLTGQTSIGITPAGDVICASNNPFGTVGCPANQVVLGIYWNGHPICGLPPNANKYCPGGQVLRGMDANSNPICVNNATPIPPLSFQFDFSQCNWVQSMNCHNCVASCPAGRIARETRVNFSGGGGGDRGNLEVYCCRAVITP